ncbi:MAG: hypothetical protein KDK10_02825 [Maritimibacter sp.]|nr:hypothetical protein [Maritimibacter sp.]
MFDRFKTFLLDDSGAVTVDSVIVMGGVVWMGAAVVGDIGVATMGVTDRINERLEYSSVIAEILGDYGPGSELDGGSMECNAANPGNDKCVGNAGENPNGDDDWGSGSNGRSDSDSNPGRGHDRDDD